MSQQSPVSCLVVLGPTASGKTRLAVHLARTFGGEIVSADSRQVYRGLDIGSGKDLEEYTRGGAPVPYHLIDIVDLDTEFNVFEFQQRCFAALMDIAGRGALPIIAGGSGMYVEAVLKAYAMAAVPDNPSLRAMLSNKTDAELAAMLRQLKPDLHNTTDLTSRDRVVRAIEVALASGRAATASPIQIDALCLGVRWPREELKQRIRTRLRERMDAGLVAEVQSLLDRGVPPEKLDFLGLEYRFVSDFIHGRIRNRNDLFQKLSAAIIEFARKQDAWFRRMERNGIVIHWIDGAEEETARRLATAHLAKSKGRVEA